MRLGWSQKPLQDRVERWQERGATRRVRRTTVCLARGVFFSTDHASAGSARMRGPTDGKLLHSTSSAGSRNQRHVRAKQLSDRGP